MTLLTSVLVAVAVKLLLAVAVVWGWRWRRRALALNIECEGLTNKLVVAHTELDKRFARLVKLTTALIEIDRAITRRPPRRRWLATARRVARVTWQNLS